MSWNNPHVNGEKDNKTQELCAEGEEDIESSEGVDRLQFTAVG
jgi:hypothetical protein